MVSKIKFFTIPNVLTTLRLLLAIVVGIMLEMQNGAGSLAVALLIGVLHPIDMIDGKIGRKLGQTSRFGAWWDIAVDRFHDILLLLLAVKFRDVNFLWATLFLWAHMATYMMRNEILKETSGGMGRYPKQRAYWLDRSLYLSYTLVLGWSVGIPYQFGYVFLHVTMLLWCLNRVVEVRFHGGQVAQTFGEKGV